jgi:hypothetical protein
MAADVCDGGSGTLMHNHMPGFMAQVLNEVSFLCVIISVTYCCDKSVHCMHVF